jgi:UDP-glucose 4-epimerase
MVNILVTGGAGFIGTAMVKRLLTLEYNVTVIDLSQKISNLKDPCKDADYLSVNIKSSKELKRLSGARFDYIFHFAAQTSGRISQETPEVDVDTNVKGTLNMCNFARKVGNPKIIFTSSMAVYGNQDGSILENTSTQPRSNYGVSKLSGELYLKMYHDFGIKSTIFRLFNVYGPGQDFRNMKQGMASIFASQLITSGKIQVTGSLERYRDFVYVEDVVDALLLGLDNKTDGATINVGTGIKTTVKNLIESIISCSEYAINDVVVENIGGHEGDQHGSVSDCHFLRKLGWESKISLNTGLDKMFISANKELK